MNFISIFVPQVLFLKPQLLPCQLFELAGTVMLPVTYFETYSSHFNSQQGYAVVFLTRKEALRPFAVSFGEHSLLDIVANSLSLSPSGDVQVVIGPVFMSTSPVSFYCHNRVHWQQIGCSSVRPHEASSAASCSCFPGQSATLDNQGLS